MAVELAVEVAVKVAVEFQKGKTQSTLFKYKTTRHEQLQ